MKEITDNLRYERDLINQGKTALAGMDEVGRGSLAGPVLVACVQMPLDDVIDGIRDSKKLSAKRREKLSAIIKEKALQITITVIDEQEIDKINILNATKKAMLNCINDLATVDCVLVDALELDNPKYPTLPIINGDNLSYLIGCASIVAKVTRDALMTEYAREYPQYHFDKNKGYGTAEHIESLKLNGSCAIHRKTFITHFVNE